jgi:prepilin-type N-terminal cleavage/methylation domain-containing protein
MRLRGSAGFSLLEVLVALAILGVGTALTLSLISGSLGKIRKVELRNRVMHHAETVMELALLDSSIKGPTSFRGDFEDGTRWVVVVSDYEMPRDRPLQPGMTELPVKVLGYSVEVLGPESRSADVRLHTLKVIGALAGPTPPSLPGGLR